MKKHILLLTAFVFFCSCFNNLSSQTYRINMGLNSSNIQIENAKNPSIDNLNFNAGLINEFPIFNEYLSLETGLSISAKGYNSRHKEIVDNIGGKFIDRTNKMNLYYLDMPLTLKLGYNYENIKIFGKAGPYMSLGLFKKNKLTVEDYFLSETHTNWLSWDADADYNLKRFDFGLSTGIGIEINPIVLEFSYNLGLANISASANNEIYNRNFAISVGYKLSSEPSQNDEHFISFSPKGGMSGYIVSDYIDYLVLGGSVNYCKNGFLVSADYYHFLEFNLFGGSSDVFNIAGISAGKRFFKNYFIFDAQVGAGIVWYEYIVFEQFHQSVPGAEVTKHIESTIGFNMKTGIKFAPNENFAIGIEALICVNTFEPLIALPLINMEFGFMR